MTLKKVLRKLVDILLYGIISSAMAFLISLAISKTSNADLFVVMAIVGIIVAVTGALTLGHGNPAFSQMGNIGRDISGMGSQQYGSYLDMEITRVERQLTDYYKSAKNHAQFYFRSGGFNVFINGVIIFVVSILLGKIF